MTINDLKGYTVSTPASAPTPVAATTPSPNYLDRVGADYAQAGKGITDAVAHGAEALQANNGTLPSEFKTAGKLVETGLQTAGEVAGAAFSPITQAPVIKQGISTIADLIRKIPGVQHIIDNADNLSQLHPELAKDIQSIANLSLIGTPSTGVTEGLATKAGKALETSGKAAAEGQKTSFVRDLLTPEQTKAVKEAQVARTTETGSGVFKRSIVAPTPFQLRAEQEVAKIPEVSTSNTVQQNYIAIKNANQDAAERLKNDVAANDFAIPRKEITARLSEAAKELQKSPTIVGDAEKTAERLIQGAQEFINSNPGTGSGLLQARKDFDSWVLSQKPKAFDAATDNAFSIANRQIRHAFNDLLDEKAPTLGIKQSLAKQSALYDAMDTLVPKAATEADSAIGRSLQRVGQVLGTKNKVVQAVAAAAGIGGLGAAATFAPIVAGVGIPTYLLYKGGQLVLKPAVRTKLGELLKTHDSALSTADRAAVQGILNDYSDTP